MTWNTRMECPICGAKLENWYALPNAPMIRQCPNNPTYFFFWEDVVGTILERDLEKVVLERAERIERYIHRLEETYPGDKYKMLLLNHDEMETISRITLENVKEWKRLFEKYFTTYILITLDASRIMPAKEFKLPMG